MTAVQLQQQPIRLGGLQKCDVSTQFGALCHRVRNGKVQVLLITSRESGRWLTPKGWPVDNATPSQTALREAYEEAGVEGKATPVCVGIYSYQKAVDRQVRRPCIVAVFPVRVRRLLKDYPEAHMRKRKWFVRKKAAALVDEPELSAIIRQFDPARLPG